MSLDAEQPTGGAPEGAAGTGENGGGESQGQGQAQGSEFGAVLDRLSAFDQGLDERISQAIQRAQAPAPETPEAPDPYGQLDELYDDPAAAAEARQVLQSIVSSAIQQELQGAVGPLAQQFRQLRTELDVGELEERYPEIRTDAKVAEAITSKAQQLAQRLGNPDLVYDSEILEMAYLASRAQRAAASEGPADGRNPAELESAAGSAPGEQEPDWAKEIVSGYRNTGGMFGF